MKRIFILLLAVAFSTMCALALPKGKYSDGGDSTIIVTDTYIYLYIGQYSAGSFTIADVDHEAQTFVAIMSDGGRVQGRWYYKDGSLYVKIGSRTLKYCD
ncbi:MAG: hypothetical protein IKA70_00680 [Alistipes sp.]|nr:hypothetical protein [Alistipes sp.]